MEYGFAKKAGSWYEVLGERVGQGKDNAVSYLENNPDIIDELQTKIIQKQEELNK